MNTKFLFTLTVIASLFLFTSGCDQGVGNSGYEDGVFMGTILDSATKVPVEGVTVTLQDLNMSAQTDTAGVVIIDSIRLGSSAAFYRFVCSKDGYETVSFGRRIDAGDTTKLTFVMVRSDQHVFIANNIIVEQRLNDSSISGIDCINLRPIPEFFPLHRDIVIRDSMFSVGYLELQTGHETGTYTGYKTKFSPPLGNFTQYQFDTLSRYDVGSRPIDPNIDFPFDRTQAFGVPPAQNLVYAFYLLGRYEYGLRPRVYGLIRIDNTYIDPYDGHIKVVVDIKINRNENNYFLLTK